MFQPIYRFSKKIGNTSHTSPWKAKGLSDQSIKAPATSDNSLFSSLNHIGFRTRINFDGQCLKQNDKVTFNHKPVVNIYIAYEINLWSFKQSADFTLVNSLFGAVKLTKNTNFDKYKYSAYGIGFDACGSFLLSDCSGFGKNNI